MKIKLDENLPLALVKALDDLGHDTDTIPQEMLKGHDDSEVWFASQQAERLLITQDLDFSDIRKFQPGTHHGLVLVRLAMPGRKALFNRIHTIVQTEHIDSWAKCFVVVSDAKVRIRRPGQPEGL